MSIPFLVSELPQHRRSSIFRDLSVEEKETKYNRFTFGGRGGRTEIVCASLSPDESTINLPLSYCYQTLPDYIVFYNHPSPRSPYTFDIPLMKRQLQTLPQITEILDRTGSVVISLPCGWGKTVIAIYLSSLKQTVSALIIVHRRSLMDQWVYNIKKCCPRATVHLLSNKSTTRSRPEGINFYLATVSSLVKRPPGEYGLNHIGLLIVDEAHLICSPVYSQILSHIYPQYSIALTATPYRSDGCDKILELYFGPEIVYRKTYELFNVYTLSTRFKPTVEKNSTGGVDWNKIIESITLQPGVNELICRVILHFHYRNIFVLTKRVDHAEVLKKMLEAKGETDVAIFIASQREYRINSRVLISTFSKTGVGFDNPRMDMFVLATDVESQIQQYFGRVFRKEGVSPIIVDIIHDFCSFRNHLLTRVMEYTAAGGVMRKFEDWFPGLRLN